MGFSDYDSDADNIFIKLWAYRHVVISIISLIGALSFVSFLLIKSDEQKHAAMHYAYWYEQLPEKHPLKQELSQFQDLYEFQSFINRSAGIWRDINEEMIKYEFSKLDVTELGILEAYLDKKFDESKPEYLLIDMLSQKAISDIKLRKGEVKTFELLRNGVKVSFKFIMPDELFNNSKAPELHQLFSGGYAKTYIKDIGIASVFENEITAIKKGKTQAVILYGTELLKLNIIVSD